MEVIILRFIKKHKIITVILLLLSVYLFFNYTRVVNYTKNTDTKDKHYINELYKSDNRIYNNYLDPYEKKMYDIMLDASKHHKVNINIDMEEMGCIDYSDCGAFVDAANTGLYLDHPELMNYAGYMWSYKNNKFTLTMRYAYLLPFKEAIGILRTEKIVADIKEATKNMTDKEKIIYVYNWMGAHNYYDHIFMYTSKNQSIYNVFVKGNAVCAGFAKASQIIFSQIGIKSYLVLGTTSAEHMWNLIEYNGKYYYFDSTVSVGTDENSSYHYNGLRQEYMNSYNPHHETWYPEIEKTNMFEDI